MSSNTQRTSRTFLSAFLAVTAGVGLSLAGGAASAIPKPVAPGPVGPGLYAPSCGAQHATCLNACADADANWDLICGQTQGQVGELCDDMQDEALDQCTFTCDSNLLGCSYGT